MNKIVTAYFDFLKNQIEFWHCDDLSNTIALKQTLTHSRGIGQQDFYFATIVIVDQTAHYDQSLVHGQAGARD